MLNITTMPKEVLGELINFIADHEPLKKVVDDCAGSMTIQEVRAALRELAVEIKREAASEGTSAADFLCKKTTSRKTKEVLSCLSTYEEKRLLTAFGLKE